MNDLLLLSVFWVISYLAHIFLYFSQGYIQSRINSFYPQKCIQPDQQQRSEKRIPIEILYSVKSLVVTSGCIALGLWLQW